jgi:hypothetical protein
LLDSLFEIYNDPSEREVEAAGQTMGSLNRLAEKPKNREKASESFMAKKCPTELIDGRTD